VAGLLGPTVGVVGIVLVFVLGVVVSGRMRRRGATDPASGWNQVYRRPVIRDEDVTDVPGDGAAEGPAGPAMPGIRFGPDADPGDGDDGDGNGDRDPGRPPEDPR
jgi:hypothetical protein